MMTYFRAAFDDADAIIFCYAADAAASAPATPLRRRHAAA